MPEWEERQIYEIEVAYQDSGFNLNFPMEQWRDRIKKDFRSFDSIKKFYRTDIEAMAERMSEHAKEVEPSEAGELEEGPSILVSNPPEQWLEDFGRAAPYIRLAEEQLVKMALFSLVEEEIEEQKKLREAGQFKPLIIRQSAFFESYLELQSQLAFQNQKEGSLSSNEMDIIEGMGHTDRIRLAHLFGVITEEEHGYLQSMASRRNELAHNPWGEVSSDSEANIKATAENVLEILESEIEAASVEIEKYEEQPANDDFNGFDKLDIDTQLLQLSILDVIVSQDEEVSLAKIQSILSHDSDKVQQRCLRMHHIGYIEFIQETGMVTILDEGRELLEREYHIE